MPGIVTKILIWAKTYPELSTRYRETVCTAGSTEDGRPIRIYPVPVRYLPALHRYRLYNWIQAPIELNPRDPRPESFRISDPRQIKVVGFVGPEHGWQERRRVLLQNDRWRYACLQDLKDAQESDHTSIGIVKVGEVRRVALVQRTEDERHKHEETLRALRARQDAFGEGQKHLEFLPFRVKLWWRCERFTGPNACGGHSATVMDWGLGELARREGPDKALQKMENIADLATKELYLMMGNLKARPHTFGIIGMLYPKREDVIRYPVQPDLFAPRPSEAHHPSQGDEPQLGFL